MVPWLGSPLSRGCDTLRGGRNGMGRVLLTWESSTFGRRHEVAHHLGYNETGVAALGH